MLNRDDAADPAQSRLVSPRTGFLLALFLILGGVFYLKAHPEMMPELQPILAQFLPAESAGHRGRRPAGAHASRAARPFQFLPAKPNINESTLFLRNGGSVTGQIVGDTGDEILLRMDSGEVTFKRGEIERIVQPGESAGGSRAAIASGSVVTVQLINGGAATGTLLYESPTRVTLQMDSGEVSFARSEVQALLPGRQTLGDQDLALPDHSRSTPSP